MPLCFRRIDAAKEVGLSVRTVDELERAGKFVPRVRLTRRAVGYLASDLSAWLDARRVCAVTDGLGGQASVPVVHRHGAK